MSEPLVSTEADGPAVTIVTLNRPEKRNALSVRLMEELCTAVDSVGQDASQRVLILRGAGAVFCAGLDLQEASSTNDTQRSAELVARMLETVHAAPLVTIAAVQGAAIAGGGGLMAACDLVVAAEDTRIGFPEVRRGLVPALILTLLGRQIGERHLRELLLVGELISANRALQIGLVNRVVSADELLGEVRKLAATVLCSAPQATMHTKKLLEDFSLHALPEDLRNALRDHQSARQSEESEEGIAAFLEKRLPEWDIGGESS